MRNSRLIEGIFQNLKEKKEEVAKATINQKPFSAIQAKKIVNDRIIELNKIAKVGSLTDTEKDEAVVLSSYPAK